MDLEAKVGKGKEAIPKLAGLSPAELIASGATNYRRWWNNPWSIVEEGGQGNAGDWTPADATRLRSLVTAAHAKGLWIRFYTLNGHAESDALPAFEAIRQDAVVGVRRIDEDRGVSPNHQLS